MDHNLLRSSCRPLLQVVAEISLVATVPRIIEKLHFINHKDRLKTPMIRRDGYWEEVNWDEALDYAATRLAEIKRQHGADAIAGLTSARCTNEDNYLFQKMFRGVLGSNNVDHCARL